MFIRSFIHNSLKLETNQMNKEMAKQTVIFSYNWILLSSKKIQLIYTTTCMSLKDILLSESSQTKKEYSICKNFFQSAWVLLDILTTPRVLKPWSWVTPDKPSSPAPNSTQNPWAYRSLGPKATGKAVSALENQSSVGSSLNLSCHPSTYTWGSKDGAPSNIQKESWEIHSIKRMEGQEVPVKEPLELFSFPAQGGSRN